MLDLSLMTKNALLVGAVCGIYTASSTAAVLDLTGDAASSSVPLDTPTATIDNTLSDTFAYDFTDPTSVLPALGYSATSGFHGNEVNPDPDNGVFAEVLLVYTLDPYTVVADDEIVVDVYGRSGNGGNRFNRDDDYDVLLTFGGTTVASVLGEGITDGNPRFNRTSFTGLTAGLVFDGITIVGNDSNGGGTNNFTVQEVRAAAIPVPEPASLALIGLGSLAMLGRRKKA